jgi:hypothetical protein
MSFAKKQNNSLKIWPLNSLAETLSGKFGAHAGIWAHGNLRLPASTREAFYNRIYTPHFDEIFQALYDKKIRKTHVRGPAGSGKSMIGEIEIAFSIPHDQGFFYYVWPSDDDARDQCTDRVIPIIRENPFLDKFLPVKKDMRSKFRQTKIQFANGMIFHAVGKAPSNAQRVRAYKLRMEEPHLYPEMIEPFRKRLIGVVRATEATFSTGSVFGDVSDESFMEGTQKEHAIKCPHCGEFVIPKDKDLKWDKNEITFDSDKGIYRSVELRKTVRFEGPCCNKPWPSSWNPDKGIDEARLALIQNYKWETQNPDANPEIESFHWNFYSVPWIRLEDVAEEKIKASYAAHRGQYELLKDYVQKTLAEAWDESPRETGDNEIRGGYKLKEKWDKEIMRNMGCDVQQDRIYYVCRLYAQDGSSRLFDQGVVQTKEELEEKRLELNVEPRRLFYDVGFDQNFGLQACLFYGWLGLWGEDKINYPHHNRNTKRTYRLPFSPPQRGFVGLGRSGNMQTSFYFRWSNPTVKDIWHGMKNSKNSGWTVADNAAEDYFKQINVEVKRREVNNAGNQVWRYHVPAHKDNHYTDCEQMSLVGAIMDKRLPIGKTNMVGEAMHYEEATA